MSKRYFWMGEPKWQTCPVCKGRGVVPQNFYSPYPMGVAAHTAPDQCRTCKGKGILWPADVPHD